MAINLQEYNRKRDFKKTAEPKGKAVRPAKRLKYVVQHHIASRDHYDFRLEWDGALLSWAVPKGPSYNPKDKRLAVHVEDHPLDYRNFEGTIPKGEYGGGTVMLWDEGYWEPQFDVEEGLESGSLKFILHGKRLKGKWALVRMKDKEGEEDKNWLLLKEKDDLTLSSSGISDYETSIRTGRSMDEIAQGKIQKSAKNPFDAADVQLAKLVNKVPAGGDWVYEVKYDGYRMLAYADENGVRLMSRNRHDYTDKFKDVAESIRTWAEKRAMILDGEMVILNENGKTDFQALQNYIKRPKGQNLTYVVFDLLALDGMDLRNETLISRKKKLENLMSDAPNNLIYSRHVEGNGKESFTAACDAGLEGIIGKKVSSVYGGTRNGDWIKLKCDNRQEFVIGGYTLTDKKNSGLSAILLGIYENDDLIYAGRAGTGFTESLMSELTEQFKPFIRKASPFSNAPKASGGEKITWLKPNFVAEIKFAEWTDENLLRQASFKGLRTDKAPKDIKREYPNDNDTAKNTANKKAEKHKPMKNIKKTVKSNGQTITINGIKITSPNKVLFEDPVITKEDVVRYYDKIAEKMMPYMDHRIISIVRCPKGISNSCFYKKHPGADNKGIVKFPITNGDGETDEYFYIADASGIVYEAQMGTLEFHTWGSRTDSLEMPDIMVFDLDPDEGMQLERVRQGVRDIKALLDELSLTSFLKTSGGKGYHVVVPFVPSVNWETFHDFARRMAEIMEQKWPDRYTSNVRKEKRKNKIFVDWIRNGRGATSIAPYSIRARKGATVSMPITWKELDTVAPDAIDMSEALKQIKKKDPWIEFFSINQKWK